MESDPGFDLKRAVAQWRLELSATQAPGRDDPVEMERRLLGFIAELQTRGLTPKEAFLLSTQRIEGRVLDEDEDPPTPGASVWRQRLLWVLAAVLGLQTFTLVLGAATRLLRIGFGGWIADWRVGAMLYGILILSELGLAAGTLFLYRHTSKASSLEDWFKRLGLQKKAGLWCSTLAVSLIALSMLNDWCDLQIGALLQAQARSSRAVAAFDLRPLVFVYAVEWPLLTSGLLFAMFMSAKRTGVGSDGVRSQGADRAAGSAPSSGLLTLLPQQIDLWRRRLAGRKGVTEDQAKEIASHLRDSTERFIRAGLTVEESFWLAKRRLGRICEIAAQLQRENPWLIWRARLVWAWLGFSLSWALGSDGLIHTAWLLAVQVSRGGRPGWSPLVWLGPTTARSGLLWVVFCVLLLARLKSSRSALGFARRLRFAGWGILAVTALVMFSLGGGNGSWSAIRGLWVFPQPLSSSEAQMSALAFQLFPPWGSGAIIWGAWLLLGRITRTALLIGSVFLLLRPIPEATRSEMGIEGG